MDSARTAAKVGSKFVYISIPFCKFFHLITFSRYEEKPIQNADSSSSRVRCQSRDVRRWESCSITSSLSAGPFHATRNQSVSSLFSSLLPLLTSGNIFHLLFAADVPSAGCRRRRAAVRWVDADGGGRGRAGGRQVPEGQAPAQGDGRVGRRLRRRRPPARPSQENHSTLGRRLTHFFCTRLFSLTLRGILEFFCWSDRL